MRKIWGIFGVILLATNASAKDVRLYEMMHLVVAVQKCDFKPSDSSRQLMDVVMKKVDAAEAQAVIEQTKPLVEKEFIQDGPVTFCWNTWDKLRAGGFL